MPISNVLAYELTSEWWRSDKGKRHEVAADISNVLAQAKNDGAIKSELYESLRYDCSMIFWLLTVDPKHIVGIKAQIDKILSGYASIKYGFLSIYENKGRKDTEGKDYFVAYPITKSNEWYLLDKSRRSEIMSEHIDMATKDPNNKGINSYTTTSFGIDDNEFVVLYELNSIEDWVQVTQNLRSAKARKWITNDRPVLVGHKGNLDSIMA